MLKYYILINNILYKISNPHRISSNGPVFVENKSIVNDFVLDPFDENTLVAGFFNKFTFKIYIVCENGNLNIWKLYENGDLENKFIPNLVLSGHSHRATLLNYHCSAKNIIASSDTNGETKIWDLDKEQLFVTCKNSNNSHVLFYNYYFKLD